MRISITPRMALIRSIFTVTISPSSSRRTTKYGNPDDPNIFRPNKKKPPCRDVVLLPKNGFAVIAFQTDNPGMWLMHCHIANHASAGLLLQIIERHAAANHPGRSNALDVAHTLCASWNSWAYDCKNYWPGNIGNESAPGYPSCADAVNLQNESGV
ncbi:putative Lcc2 [Colletotrichum sublineola]|uniref:Putative Lcc2 n=1 Tax=Colletotrichum sublineola TaxID=1173701 RepID=A0A066XF39_COLSU|nr:putative Lcc2 [Colletotrichum sublineola]